MYLYLSSVNKGFYNKPNPKGMTNSKKYGSQKRVKLTKESRGRQNNC